MFSRSAFSVGRALDTTQKCGEGGEGIVVMGVSDMFTSEVENPVQFFIPKFYWNDESETLREVSMDELHWPVQEVHPEDYNGEQVQPPPDSSEGFAVPQDLASLHAFFQVLDRNGEPMNGEATDVAIQWIQVPESVSFFDTLVAKHYGGEQLSHCPEGGSVLSGVAKATIECLLQEEMSCDDIDAVKTVVRWRALGSQYVGVWLYYLSKE